MRASEIKHVQDNWKVISKDSDALAKTYYDILFEINPQLQSLFKRNMDQQGRKLISMFSSAIDCLDDTGKLLPPLLAAGKRHTQYGVTIEDYNQVTTALLETIKQTLGNDYNEETARNWKKACTLIASTMQKAMDCTFEI